MKNVCFIHRDVSVCLLAWWSMVLVTHSLTHSSSGYVGKAKTYYDRSVLRTSSCFCVSVGLVVSGRGHSLTHSFIRLCRQRQEALQ